MVKSVFVGLMFCLVSMPGVAAQWSGVVDWTQRTEMATTVSGVVTRVAVKAGERVKKGQLLLQLEQGALQARLEQRKAEMQHKELMLKEASKELERAEELYARTLLADHDLDLAKIAHAYADAAYRSSRADHPQAGEDLANSSLRAPYDAVVLSRNVQPAEAVVSRCQAQALLTLAPTETLRVRIYVDADKLPEFKINSPLMVEVAGQRYQGKVDAIAYEPETFNESVRHQVDVVFSGGDVLLVGQNAKVSQP